MMFERFNQDARSLVGLASAHARRLGHRYVGAEHLLLAVASAGQAASAVLAAHGVTPDFVEEQIVLRAGLGAGAGLFGGLDKDALATIGIDLDAVRARIEASFGQQALANAAQMAHHGLLRNRGPSAPRMVRQWRRRRRARRAVATAPAPRPPEATGRYCAPGPHPIGHIPFTPASKKVLELSLREALALQQPHVGAEHVALALITIKQGLVPPILAAAGAPAAELRTAILDRYRQAS
jgi:hypothetical protein